MSSVKIDVKVNGLAETIRALEAYRKSIEGKIDTFMTELSAIGISVINPIIGEYKNDVKSQTGLTPSMGKPRASKVKRIGKNKYRLEVLLSGHEVLFMEFSTGVTYGTKPGQFPKGINNDSYGAGYGVGTFNPSSKNAWRVKGWYFQTYRTRGGHRTYYHRHTMGTRAYMPMWKASRKMWQQIDLVASKVFST